MPGYATPGVYIEEIEIGPRPIEGVSTSIAGFLGKAERGPITPFLITSFDQYQRNFGTYLDNSYLTYAVYGFFRNGGQQCYIGRITKVSGKPDEIAQSASKNIDIDTIDPNKPISIQIRAIGPGNWGNQIYYKIEEPTQQVLAKDAKTPTRFRLSLFYFQPPPPSPVLDPTDLSNRKDPNRRDPDRAEVYDNLSVDPNSNLFYKNQINNVSHMVVVFDNIPVSGGKVYSRPPLSTGTTPDGKHKTLDPFDTNPGTDGKADASGNVAPTIEDYQGTEIDLTDPFTQELVAHQKNGLEGFKNVDDISIVCAPDESSFNETVAGELTYPLRDLLIDHCEELMSRIAIIQTGLQEAAGDLGNLKPSRDSKYAALYSPWINVFDPLTNGQKLIPPGAYVAGVYARRDSIKGVHYAPANEPVNGLLSLQRQITKDEQAVLNPRGVNVIRSFPGLGPTVWGARTISTDTLWMYVNVRRLFIFIEQSIVRGTQYLVFEANNERLWSRVIATIKQFLTQVWHDGALMGTTPEEAFFVKCDRTTMTQNDIDNGRLIVLIGIAPVKPAEFVIFRIAQVASGASVTEI